MTEAAGEPNDTAPVVIGRITGPYGVKGWVRVASFTDPPDNLLSYRPWLVWQQSRWQPLAVHSVKPHGKGYVAHVEGCDNRDQAEALSGTDLATPAAALPEPDAEEFYWRDLLGLQVRTTNGTELGTVAQLFETGANDVMVVAGADRERLVPFIAPVVVEVLLQQQLLIVDWDPDF